LPIVPVIAPEEELLLVLVDELELLLDEVLEELLLDEVLEELELDEELLPVPPGPVHEGPVKLPSCVPWKPKAAAAVWPGAGTCQLQQLVAVKVVPEVGDIVTFQLPVIVVVSGKFRVSVQLLGVVVPLLVTETSIWYELACRLVTAAVQVMPVPPLVLEDELELLLEEPLLEELDEELELLLEELDDELLDDELELLEPFCGSMRQRVPALMLAK
jgi:hypothetical protein